MGGGQGRGGHAGTSLGAGCAALAALACRRAAPHRPPPRPAPHAQERGLPTVATSVAVWIPYNLAAFKLVPEQLRPLSGGILGAYMSVSCINTPACSAATAAAVAAALDAQQ